MKNLLASLAVILFSMNAFGQGAQYRPTPFANGFVQTVTSQGTAQTYLGIGSSTNYALLNGTNTFTGTNTFSTNTVLGTNRVGDFLGYGVRRRVLWQTNNAVITLVAGTTNTVSSIIVPPLFSSNSTVRCNYGMTKLSEAATVSATWELREDDGSGEIVWGASNGGATVTVQFPAPVVAFVLTSFSESFGLGKAYVNNTTQTNYFSSRGWDTNRILNLSIIGGGSGTNTIVVPSFSVFEEY